MSISQHDDVTPANGLHRPRSVLVIDDHRDTADSLVLLLQAYGYRAAAAPSGAAGLAAAERDRPDAVVLELRLAGELDGWEVARRLRAGGDRIPVIALTTCGSPEDRQRSAAAGIDWHLIKPADPRALLAALEAAFEGLGVIVPELATSGAPREANG